MSDVYEMNRIAIWSRNQRDTLRTIYILVLKFGWSIELDKVTPEGTYIFNANCPDPLDLASWNLTLTWSPIYDRKYYSSGEK
jgi:hypothetical protein